MRQYYAILEKASIILGYVDQKHSLQGNWN